MFVSIYLCLISKQGHNVSASQTRFKNQANIAFTNTSAQNQDKSNTLRSWRIWIHSLSGVDASCLEGGRSVAQLTTLSQDQHRESRTVERDMEARWEHRKARGLGIQPVIFSLWGKPQCTKPPHLCNLLYLYDIMRVNIDA